VPSEQPVSQDPSPQQHSLPQPSSPSEQTPRRSQSADSNDNGHLNSDDDTDDATSADGSLVSLTRSEHCVQLSHIPDTDHPPSRHDCGSLDESLSALSPLSAVEDISRLSMAQMGILIRRISGLVSVVRSVLDCDFSEAQVLIDALEPSLGSSLLDKVRRVVWNCPLSNSLALFTRARLRRPSRRLLLSAATMSASPRSSTPSLATLSPTRKAVAMLQPAPSSTLSPRPPRPSQKAQSSTPMVFDTCAPSVRSMTGSRRS
jgi:hypothetical protein